MSNWLKVLLVAVLSAVVGLLKGDDIVKTLSSFIGGYEKPHCSAQPDSLFEEERNSLLGIANKRDIHFVDRVMRYYPRSRDRGRFIGDGIVGSEIELTMRQ